MMQIHDPDPLKVVERAVARGDLQAVSAALTSMDVEQVVGVLERLRPLLGALVYRLLPKGRALVVFERMNPMVRADLVRGLRTDEVATVFASLDPDDRALLLDELPASVATRLLSGLTERDRDLTSTVLGYPRGVIGRRMSSEYIAAWPDARADEVMRRVRELSGRAETVYTIPVVDDERRLVGILELRDVLAAPDDRRVSELLQPVVAAHATDPAEQVARRCADGRRLALPIVDAEMHLVGILTVDDALTILQDAESEDQARISGSEPLRRPYLSTPIPSLVASRLVWLLVLAIGATLTVQVLEVFEATLDQMIVLSVFIPLLIGTGGNTGNQAATTVTRALALGDLRPRDVLRVALRELRVGALLGVALGAVGFVFTSLVYSVPIGTVIGLTLFSVCSMAATVGGAMPMVARAIRADPAVFSNPFITTFVDAAGLLIYFVVARAVLGI